MSARKDRITRAFSSHAGVYDAAADLQWQVAENLAERIISGTGTAPQRILEIGCGTGFLSGRLASAFPDSRLLLTDIAPSMLERCRERLGGRHEYRVLDGERPEGLPAVFDLIASNLAFQWFVDMPMALEKLTSLLAPGGRMIFSTLGRDTFVEWREAHKALGLACGTPPYPSLADFALHHGEEEIIRHPYADGRDFVATLKLLGASEPAPGYHPLSPGAFRRLLNSLAEGFQATYHILYGEIRR